MLAAIWLSFGVVFVAELGDKSQLMALSFATRFRPLPVLAAITVATALLLAVSVLAGDLLGAALPTFWIGIAAGLAFLAFAAWTLRGDKDDESEDGTATRVSGSAFASVFVTFLLSELGDKTMLATLTLATRQDALGTWLGATLGMVVADGLAIVVGRQLGQRLPERAVRIGAAALFALFGAWLLIEAFASR